jgi:hypothetical protein
MTLAYVNSDALSVMPYSTNSLQRKTMAIIRNVTVDLGPRDVVIGGKVIATVANVTVEVEESTEEELAALKKEPVLLLVKPLIFREEDKSP